MFLQVSLLTLAVLQAAHCAPLQDEKITPVDLSYFCLHIQLDGKENNKSPVLLLHALADTHSSWDGVQQVLAFRTGRRVCAADLRNHGNSPWSNDVSIEAMAADIGNFLDKQNIQKVNLIGHSLGGKVSVHYTLNNPERVDSLVVEDLTPNIASTDGLKVVQVFVNLLLEAMKSISEVSTEEEARKIVLDFLNKKLTELGLEEAIDENFRKGLKVHCANGTCKLLINPYLLQKIVDDPSFLMIESKGLYEGPTLFIYGKASPFHVNEDEKNIHRLFPNATLVGVEGAGHSIHGRFKEFDDEVIKFLNH